MSSVTVSSTVATVSVTTTEHQVVVQSSAQPSTVNVIATGPQGPSGGLRIDSYTSATTITPNIDAFDFVSIDALAAALSFANPTGTPVNGQRLIIRILDNGSARALSWGAAYASGGVPLPTSTTASKRTHLGFIYDGFGLKWYLVAAVTQT
jgi:hypothetical protein